MYYVRCMVSIFCSRNFSNYYLQSIIPKSPIPSLSAYQHKPLPFPFTFRTIEEYSTNLYNALFAECSLEDGKYLSKSERERNKLHENKSLIYGEVEFRSFSRVLRKINPAPGGVFYDLGSGTSKAVFVVSIERDQSYRRRQHIQICVYSTSCR